MGLLSGSQPVALSVVTAPTEYPVTLMSVKDHLRIDVDDDDDLLMSLLPAAVSMVEDDTGRVLSTRTLALGLDGIPPEDDPIELLVAPVTSVTAIVSYDVNDASSTFSASSYFLDSAAEPGRVCLKGGYSWPSGLRPHRAVVVTFVAGYASADAVPPMLAVAVRMRMLALYERRDFTDAETRLYDTCIGPWRLERVG